MRIKLPSSRKGRVWAAVGAFVGLVSVFGTISDATADPRDHQYEMCMKAYHDAKHCYEDVYSPKSGDASTPTDDPTVPPTDWNPLPVRHFHFNPDAPLDTTQVVDLR